MAINVEVIEQILRVYHIRKYELATEIGVSEYTLIRWLRDEKLPKEREERIKSALKKLVDNAKGAMANDCIQL